MDKLNAKDINAEVRVSPKVYADMEGRSLRTIYRWVKKGALKIKQRGKHYPIEIVVDKEI